VANNSKDFRSWFGFCEARLRIFIASLESPENGVQAYPFARFFFRKVPLSSPVGTNSSSSGAAVAVMPDGGKRCTSTTLACVKEPKVAVVRQQHVSSFFVALRFAPNIECFDLTGSAQEMLFKLNSWEDRVEGMDMTMEHLMQSQLPAFVFEKSVIARDGIDFNNGGESANDGGGGATRRHGNDDDSTRNGPSSSSSSSTTRSRAELGKRRNTSSS
jgi:poly(A) polymerase Pap1